MESSSSSNSNVNGCSGPDRSGDDMGRDGKGHSHRGIVVNANTKNDGTTTTESSIQPDVATSSSWNAESYGENDVWDEELYVPPGQNPTKEQLAKMLTMIEGTVNRSITVDGHSPTSHLVLKMRKGLFNNSCFYDKERLAELDEFFKMFVKLGGPTRLMLVMKNGMEDPDTVTCLSRLYSTFFSVSFMCTNGTHLNQQSLKFKKDVEGFIEDGGIWILRLSSEEFETSLNNAKSINAVSSVWRLLGIITNQLGSPILCSDEGLDLVESAYICAERLARHTSSLSKDFAPQKKFALSRVAKTVSSLLYCFLDFGSENFKESFVETWHQRNLFKPFLDFFQLHKASLISRDIRDIQNNEYIVCLFAVGRNFLRLSNDDLLKMIDITMDMLSNVPHNRHGEEGLANRDCIYHILTYLEILTAGVERKELEKTSLFSTSTLSSILQSNILPSGPNGQNLANKCLNLLEKISKQTGDGH